ncbi:MAG: hypothetical protein IPL53_18745 [Ignavibacteria bacterium]|nr:hypothetical protein [Ignavibacteria bacterium]
MTPANYDITNALSVIGSYSINDQLVAGISYKISTGKPYTPVNETYFDPT